jgi:hypothetical protein
MDSEISAAPSQEEPKLNTVLAQLGLGQYEQPLMDNGFETWETVTRITEADMNNLGFKLGHRRKLQRAIREHDSSTTPEMECLARNLSFPYGGLPVIGAQPKDFQPQHESVTPVKRQYRRHPRPDHNAPYKPKTAYVLFTEHVRTDPAISSLPFAEIAKEVGKRWGNLSQEERSNVWEKPVADQMREYRAEFERYKTTESYRSYQSYLEGFRQEKHKSEEVEQSNVSQSQDGSQASPQRTFDGAMPPNSNTYSSVGSSQHLTAPTEAGTEEVGRVLNSLGVSPHYFKFNAFPPESITHIAVEAFLHGTGSLLYLWGHDEALDLVKSVYLPKRGTTQLEATELFAMASIGSYCDGEAITMSIRDEFLHFFVSMLNMHSEMCDFRRMRLLSCLAICQFTSRIESARKLICMPHMLPEHYYDDLPLQVSALEIGRQAFTSPSFAVGISHDKARYWWNVFRSVVFLERFVRAITCVAFV